MPQAENKMDFAIQNKQIEFDPSYTVRLFFSLTSEALCAEIPVYLNGSYHEKLNLIFQCTLTLTQNFSSKNTIYWNKAAKTAHVLNIKSTKC